MCYGKFKLKKFSITGLLLIIFSMVIVLAGGSYRLSLAGEKQEFDIDVSKTPLSMKSIQ